MLRRDRKGSSRGSTGCSNKDIISDSGKSCVHAAWREKPDSSKLRDIWEVENVKTGCKHQEV